MDPEGQTVKKNTQDRSGSAGSNGRSGPSHAVFAQLEGNTEDADGARRRGMIMQPQRCHLPQPGAEGRLTFDYTGVEALRALDPHAFGSATTVPHHGNCIPDWIIDDKVIDNRYEIHRLLGRGGMGQVFEARDMELNRRVAIKFSLSRHQPDTLQREGRFMAAFQHPGLISVYTSGRCHGMNYVVMELVTGSSLSDYASQNNLSDLEIRDILLAITDSLCILHEANLVHRDLKPANIMVAARRRIVLLDFGICDLNCYIHDAGLFGSPHYLAPEAIAQVITSSEAHLLDIYSLGAIGYWLLSRCHPHTAGSLDELLYTVVTEAPLPIVKLRPTLHQPLADLIMEMLARNSSARPQSADVVASRLRTMQIVEVKPGACNQANQCRKCRGRTG